MQNVLRDVTLVVQRAFRSLLMEKDGGLGYFSVFVESVRARKLSCIVYSCLKTYAVSYSYSILMKDEEERVYDAASYCDWRLLEL